MDRVFAFVASGFEEVECLTVVDILRRAGIQVLLTSVSSDLQVTGSHGITVVTDQRIDEADFDSCDVLFLPGGVPGTPNLAASDLLCRQLCRFSAQGKRIAAICAAPSVPGDLGLLEGYHVTCYPGWESHLRGAVYENTGVITDRNITTGRGMGFAVDMGLELVRILKGEDTAFKLKTGIQHPDTL